MMKRLFYSTCSYASPHIEVIANEIMKCAEKGDSAYWVQCNGIITSCFMNPMGNSLRCQLCHTEYQSINRRLSGKAKIIDLAGKKEKSSNDEIRSTYSSIEEIKRIEYRGVHIGLSILSYYFTITRNIEPRLDQSFCKYINDIEIQMRNQIDALFEIVNDVKIDDITIYNGRFFEVRALYDIARSLNVHFTSLEVIGGVNEPYYMVRFDNVLPHDITYFANECRRIWTQADEIADERDKIAKDFFYNRRSAKPAGDKIYTKNQVQGKLPEGIDYGKRNIVIFNSSADEIAAIGGEWDENQIFDNQYEAIEYMLSNVSDKSIHFYLRIHPNLSNVHYRFVEDLYKLPEKYNNITIIRPNSDISSYALMDIAEKIIVFGSTMGIEACFWDKPVLLIGKAFYYWLDVAYKIDSKMSLIELVNAKLEAKSKEDCLKYGYFILDRKYRTVSNLPVEINPKTIKFNRHIIKYNQFLTLWNSSILFKLVHLFCVRISKYIGHNNIQIP